MAAAPPAPKLRPPRIPRRRGLPGGLLLPVACAAALLCGCGGEETAETSAARKARPPRGGKFFAARDHAGDREQLARELGALGYAAGSEPGRPGTGVVALQRQKAQDGYFFFTSGHAPVALLIDLEGEIAHRWRASIPSIWPDRAELAQRFDGTRHYWRRARLLPDGSVLALFTDVGLVALDRDSRILWSHAGRTHHDLDLDDRGRILVLERDVRAAAWLAGERGVVEDDIVVLDPNGQERERVALLFALTRGPYAAEMRSLLREAYRERLETERRLRSEFSEMPDRPAGPVDLLHTNTIQWLDGSQVHLSPAFARGNVLLSIRELDLLVVLDLGRREVVWSLQGPWHRQHEPVLLDSGTILLFDNKGPEWRGEKGFSEALELDPLTGRILWTWRARRPGAFYSGVAGSCQRLPNGNTLVTESTQGRAFQIDPAGEIVWDYHSPFRAGERGEYVAFLPEMTWIAAEKVEAWLSVSSASRKERGR